MSGPFGNPAEEPQAPADIPAPADQPVAPATPPEQTPTASAGAAPAGDSDTDALVSSRVQERIEDLSAKVRSYAERAETAEQKLKGYEPWDPLKAQADEVGYTAQQVGQLAAYALQSLQQPTQPTPPQAPSGQQYYDQYGQPVVQPVTQTPPATPTQPTVPAWAQPQQPVARQQPVAAQPVSEEPPSWFLQHQEDEFLKDNATANRLPSVADKLVRARYRQLAESAEDTASRDDLYAQALGEVKAVTGAVQPAPSVPVAPAAVTEAVGPAGTAPATAAPAPRSVDEAVQVQLAQEAKRVTLDEGPNPPVGR